MIICWYVIVFVFFKQKTAYEVRISDWSSDVCSSDLRGAARSPGRSLALEYQRSGADCGGRCLARAIDTFEGRVFSARGRVRPRPEDRRSVVQGKSVSVRVDIGGRRIIQKKTKNV